jgi:hypothetical protein
MVLLAAVGLAAETAGWFGANFVERHSLNLFGNVTWLIPRIARVTELLRLNLLGKKLYVNRLKKKFGGRIKLR